MPKVDCCDLSKGSLLGIKGSLLGSDTAQWRQSPLQGWPEVPSLSVILLVCSCVEVHVQKFGTKFRVCRSS